MAIKMNFRATAGYVTDNPGEIYVLHTDTYPTTRGGVTFGYLDAGMDSRDRDSTVDVRLAGINFSSGSNRRFQVDLPTVGVYDIDLGYTDVGSAYTNGVITFKDNTTTLFSIGTHSVSNVLIYDANDNLHTSTTNWSKNHTVRRTTFSTTSLIVHLDGSTGSTLASIAYLGLAVRPSFQAKMNGGTNIRPRAFAPGLAK